MIDDLLPGLAAAMNTHDRTESAELEPADQHEKAAGRSVYLPAGTFFVHAGTGDRYEGGQWYEVAADIHTIPVFLREGRQDYLMPGLAAAMNTHDRTESAELEPADQQLLKTIVVDIAAVESTDIRGPPGNSAKPHMYARADWERR